MHAWYDLFILNFEYQFEKDEPPRLVHRLDKDTSGVLLLARTKEMARILGKYFKEPEKHLQKIVKLFFVIISI